MIAYTNPETQEYEFNLPQGDYEVNFEGYGGEKETRKLNLPLTYPSDSYSIARNIAPQDRPYCRSLC